MDDTIRLTTAQQDYLEAVHHLANGSQDEGVRVTDLASSLGTRLPTVVRTIAKLKRMNLVTQKERGLVYMSALGAKIGRQLAHRHDDVLRFLIEVLGVDGESAGIDSCVIEHGLSAMSAQRLHEFLERWDDSDEAVREDLGGGDTRSGQTDFNLLRSGNRAGERQ